MSISEEIERLNKLRVEGALSEADSRDCVKLLREQLLPVANMFGYCQVASAYGSGNFINVLHEHLRGHPKTLTSRVNSKDDIYDSIKTFFGKGH